MCTSPIRVKRSNRIDQVPCGKCAECRKAQQNYWYLRFLEESKEWRYVYFFTYTYDNEHLPYVKLQESWNRYCFFGEDKVDEVFEQTMNTLFDGLRKLPRMAPWYYHRNHPNPYNDYLFFDRLEDDTLVPVLVKSHISDHFKRCRANFKRLNGRTLEMKYFVQGEYGPNTLRPHWHGLIFTNEPLGLIKDLFVSDWTKYHNHSEASSDRNNFNEVSDRKGRGAVARYCAKYVCKPTEFQSPYVNACVLPPPPRVVSKNLGHSYRVRTCTEQAREAVAAVKTEEDYEQVANLYFFYYLSTEKGVFKYKKPRYWLEWYYPMETVNRQCIQYFLDDKRVTKKQIVDYETKLYFKQTEPHTVDYEYVSSEYERLDRSSTFAQIREDFILHRNQKKEAQRLAGYRSARPHATMADCNQYLADCEAHEMDERNISALTQHASFYQANSLRYEHF